MSQLPNLKWTEKIKSDSRVLNPIGIQYHTRLQILYVPGITSVTNRMRYYTLQAWFFQNKSAQVQNPHKLERLFILASLAHHNGQYNHESIHHIFSKEYYKNNWDGLDSFSLENDFAISRFGRTYYVSQLEVFRCAWFGIGTSTITPVNDELASSISIPTKHLDKSKINKSDLSEYSQLCICNSEKNQKEIDTFSKILFGFLEYSTPEKLEQNIEEKYSKNKLDLDFKGTENISIEENILERNQRRRNTLFMYLKIIDHVNPTRNKLEKFVCDVIYFKQNPDTKGGLDFGRLERIRKYWQIHQYLIFYVYAMECILDSIQYLLRENPIGIQKEELLSHLKSDEINAVFEEITSGIKLDSTIGEIITKINQSNQSKIPSLDDIINERFLYERIEKSQTTEEELVLSILLLFLLKTRFESLPSDILEEYLRFKKNPLIPDDLNIFEFMNSIDKQNSQKISEFLKELLIKITVRHLFEASDRYAQKTKNWIFSEDSGYLYPSGRPIVKIRDRNNRWNPIFTLLVDAEMLEVSDYVKLTEKGKKWLKWTE